MQFWVYTRQDTRGFRVDAFNIDLDISFRYFVQTFYVNDLHRHFTPSTYHTEKSTLREFTFFVFFSFFQYI